MLVQVVNPDLRKYEGMTFAGLGRLMGRDPRDAAMDVALADHGNSSVVIAIMTETDVLAAVSNPLLTYGSDSPSQAEDGPLSYNEGTSSGVRNLYSHTGRICSRARRMTSQAASRVGITWNLGYALCTICGAKLVPHSICPRLWRFPIQQLQPLTSFRLFNSPRKRLYNVLPDHFLSAVIANFHLRET